MEEKERERRRKKFARFFYQKKRGLGGGRRVLFQTAKQGSSHPGRKKKKKKGVTAKKGEQKENGMQQFSQPVRGGDEKKWRWEKVWTEGSDDDKTLEQRRPPLLPNTTGAQNELLAEVS